MKAIKKKAECVAVVYHNGERFLEWRCPTCDNGIAEEYICCPYCGQRLKFEKISVGQWQSHITISYKSIDDLVH